MVKLLKKIGMLVFAIIAIIGFFYALNWVLIRNFKLVKEDTTTLLLGDSHIQFSLNDSIIPHSINVAVGGESYFYSYQKLKFFTQNYPGINTVVLGFAEHNVDKIYEEQWIKNPVQIREWTSKYCNFYDLDAFKTMAHISFWDLCFGMIRIPFYSFKFIYSYIKDPSFRALRMGGYKGWLNYSVLKKQLAEIQKREGITDLNFSDVNIKYLDKIIEYTRDNHIQLILLSTPIHKELYKYDKTIHLKFKDFYNKRYSQVTFWNYTTFEMQDDCFKDLVHLRIKGANLFSQTIKHELQNHHVVELAQPDSEVSMSKAN